MKNYVKMLTIAIVISYISYLRMKTEILEFELRVKAMHETCGN